MRKRLIGIFLREGFLSLAAKEGIGPGALPKDCGRLPRDLARSPHDGCVPGLGRRINVFGWMSHDALPCRNMQAGARSVSQSPAPVGIRLPVMRINLPDVALFRNRVVPWECSTF